MWGQDLPLISVNPRDGLRVLEGPIPLNGGGVSSERTVLGTITESGSVRRVERLVPSSVPEDLED